MLLLYFKQYAVGRVVRKTIELSIGEYSREDVWMYIFVAGLGLVLFDRLQILTLFDLFELFIYN
jgi:hypothetical protein